MSDQREGQDLEDLALNIATEHLLGGVPFKELSSRYHYSPATLHRRFQTWLNQKRFQLVDKQDRRTVARFAGFDDGLGARLSKAAQIRARVAIILGAEAACSPLRDDGPQPELAYLAADRLHLALAEATAPYLMDRLRNNMHIGVAAGRGVGFTIDKLGELSEKRPGWLTGYSGIHLYSLSGGGRVGAWYPITRDLDADENVFRLASILQINRQAVHYMRGWISKDDNGQKRPPVPEPTLDLAFLGIGQLNRQHHFYHFDQKEFGPMQEPLEVIWKFQEKDGRLRDSVAEVCHRLFLACDTSDVPQEFLDAVKKVNNLVLAVEARRISEAEEVLVVGAGASKKAALLALLTSVESPIERRHLTLFTDAWTAKELLEAL
ncbi:MAG: hypothetical protein HYY02_01535 [Chloroflexi bacterium]|nr:hypothetical protein [Chloroflexota bacterium]